MFEYAPTGTDNQRLRNFVEKVEELVSTAVNTGRWQLSGPPPHVTNLHLHPDAISEAKAALKEFTDQQHLPALLLAIDNASVETLALHGLTGAQLKFKLTVVGIKEKIFRSLPNIKWLRGLIEAIDNLLESIFKALNLDDALKELKDAVFHATEDDKS